MADQRESSPSGPTSKVDALREPKNSTTSDDSTTTAKPSISTPSTNKPHPAPPASSHTQTSSRTIPSTIGRAAGALSAGLSHSSSRSPSNVTSPQSSRDSSPAGRAFRQQSIPGASSSQGMRSRKDSQDVSPHRPPSISGYGASIPSAAAIQRALSAASAPQLQPAPTSDPSSRIARPLPRTSTTVPNEETPSWPASPRLKSPPPSSSSSSRSRNNSLRTIKNPESQRPNIIVQNATPSSSSDALSNLDHLVPNGADARQSAPPQKSASRGVSGASTLETVQETSNPTTPGEGLSASSSTNHPDRKYFDLSEEDRKASSEQATPRRSMAPPKTPGKLENSDSDSGVKKKDGAIKGSDGDLDKTPRPTTISNRPSFSSLRAKTPAEPFARNMTVETETVNSVAQNALGAPSDRVSSGRMDHSGTLRAKTSTDTIKPGKSRKKPSRKAPSINATTVSTRADIFEDRVKNEMEEATSDDSDETFVYESNPPEPPLRRSRHHSRTPSGASLASLERNARPAQSALTATKTRSMKFANAHVSDEDSIIVRQDGTIRANNSRSGGSSIHHHHSNRPIRNATGHTSILDDESPFPPLNKVRSLTGLPGRGTQNARSAFRNLNTSNGGSGLQKSQGYMSYDMDADGGDDERTPLMVNTGSMRTPRNQRRPPTRGSRSDRYSRRRQSLLSRFAGCIAIVSMLFMLVFGIVGFLFIISTPLQEVKIHSIENVLASEQSIMFDLVVGAVNPNLLPISIGEMDMNIFARSKFVGSERWWREHPDGDWNKEPFPRKPARSAGRSTHVERYIHAPDRVSVRENFLHPIPYPAPDDSESDGDVSKHTMLLGRVDHFDNPLTFDPSFLKRHEHTSRGAIRLSRPGNRTELGGSERWERVLLHDFELILRGTLEYNIPLGGRSYAAAVGANITVKAGSDDVTPDQPKDFKKVNYASSYTNADWKIEVRPVLQDEGEMLEAVEARLIRRVWARVLRQF